MAEDTDPTAEYLAAGPEERRRPHLRPLLAALMFLSTAALAWTSVGPSGGRPDRPPAGSEPSLPARPPGALASFRRQVRAPAPPTSTTRPAPPATPAGYGCAAALAWLSAHAAPGFRLLCPGYAAGHQAMTCVNVAGLCPGARVIAIADPCPAAYMNEASNSWVLTGRVPGRLDPYGHCA